jgi:hypothetical protein
MEATNPMKRSSTNQPTSARIGKYKNIQAGSALIYIVRAAVIKFVCNACNYFGFFIITISEALIIVWVEFFYSVLIEVRVRCHQLSCHNCFHFAVFFNLCLPRLYFGTGNRRQSSATNSPSMNSNSLSCLVTKLYNVNFFSDRLATC